MNTQIKINLRQTELEWQAKQKLSGAVAIVISAFTAGWIVHFLRAPSLRSAIVMGVLMALMMAACSWVLACAAMLAKLRNTPQPLVIHADIVGLEALRLPRAEQPRPLRRKI